MPTDYKKLKYIDRFNSLAIDGELSYKEMKRMTVVENIINGYRGRQRAMQDDVVKWRQENRDISNLLDYAEKLVNDGS